MTETELIQTADALQMRYLRALDGADMAGWAACFADPASYACYTRENVEQGLEVAMILDDSLDRIHDRVKYVNVVWKGTFDEYKTRHFVQRVDYRLLEAGVLHVESHVLVTYVNSTGVPELLATGVYQDEIVMESEARFRSKRVIMDSPMTPRYLVYPL